MKKNGPEFAESSQTEGISEALELLIHLAKKALDPLNRPEMEIFLTHGLNYCRASKRLEYHVKNVVLPLIIGIVGGIISSIILTPNAAVHSPLQSAFLIGSVISIILIVSIPLLGFYRKRESNMEIIGELLQFYTDEARSSNALLLDEQKICKDNDKVED